MHQIKVEKLHSNCDQNSQDVDSNSNLKKYPEKNLYVCNICQKAFSNIKDHIDHLKTHAIKQPYICEFCQMTFSECIGLEKHIDIHTEHYPLSEKPFPCEFCPKAFSANRHLRKHLIVHAEQKPFTCEHCKMSFTCKENLANHLKVHDIEPTHIYLSKNFIKESVKQEPAEKEVKFFCDYCQSGFQSKHVLQQHEKIKCEKNDSQAANHLILPETESSMKNKRTNSKKKNTKYYTCEFCQKTLSRKDVYADHLKMHSGLMKRHVCHCCKTSFSHRKNLMEHLKYHTREKPYSCHFCIKAFKNNKDLVQHEKVHTK